MDAAGAIVPGGGQIASVGDTMFVALPMDMIRRLSPTGSVHKQFQLQVKYDRVDGTPAGIIVMSKTFRVDVEPMQQQLIDLSTLPTGPDHLKENVILNVLANKNAFPLQDPDISQWSWNISSEMHDGLAINAVDLNLDGTSDHGKEVRVPYRGQVIRTGTDGTHTVILKHETLSSDGSVVTWYSKYLHMENVGTRDVQGNITSLTINERLEANMVLGQVGDIGSPGQFHFHFEVMTDLTDGYNGHTIDLRNLLIEPVHGLGITRIYAEDAGVDGQQRTHADNQRFRVKWNNEVAAFVTVTDADDRSENNPMLILDRSDQGGESNVATDRSNQYWIAWHPDVTKRARVVWVQNLPDGTKVNSWLKTDDFSKKWDPALHEFLSR